MPIPITGLVVVLFVAVVTLAVWALSKIFGSKENSTKIRIKGDYKVDPLDRRVPNLPKANEEKIWSEINKPWSTYEAKSAPPEDLDEE